MTNNHFITNDTNGDLKFFCLPVSGKFFPIQIGQLNLLLTDSKYLFTPHTIFCSSGGNITTYLAHANDWNPSRILASFDLFDSESFLTTWLNKIPFNFITLIYNKSLFCKGYGFENFFKYFFNPNIKTGYSPRAEGGPEIFTGVVSISKKSKKSKHLIYSNKSSSSTLYREASIIPNKHCSCEDQESGYCSCNKISPYLCEHDKIIYLKGNVKDIAAITTSSASIPILVPTPEDDDHYYTDGGTILGSPFSCFSDSLFQTTRPPHNKILKGIFFNPNNCDFEPLMSVDVFLTELKTLVLGRYTQDIRMFVNLITCFDDMTPAKSPLKYCNVTSEIIKNVITDLESTSYHYGIMFYPNYLDEPIVNLTTKIKAEEIRYDIKKSFEKTNMYVWRKK